MDSTPQTTKTPPPLLLKPLTQGLYLILWELFGISKEVADYNGVHFIPNTEEGHQAFKAHSIYDEEFQTPNEDIVLLYVPQYSMLGQVRSYAICTLTPYFTGTGYRVTSFRPQCGIYFPRGTSEWLGNTERNLVLVNNALDALSVASSGSAVINLSGLQWRWHDYPGFCSRKPLSAAKNVKLANVLLNLDQLALARTFDATTSKSCEARRVYIALESGWLHKSMGDTILGQVQGLQHALCHYGAQTRIVTSPSGPNGELRTIAHFIGNGGKISDLANIQSPYHW